MSAEHSALLVGGTERTGARVLEQLLCMRWWLQWQGRVPK
jgi:hypothetical protein